MKIGKSYKSGFYLLFGWLSRHNMMEKIVIMQINFLNVSYL